MEEFPRMGKNLEGVTTPEAANQNVEFESFDELAQGFITSTGVITREMIDAVKQKQEPNYPTGVPNKGQKIAVHKMLLELFDTLEYKSPNKKRYNDLLYFIPLANDPNSNES